MVADALGLDRFAVMGHSGGGEWAWFIAVVQAAAGSGPGPAIDSVTAGAVDALAWVAEHVGPMRVDPRRVGR